MDKLNRDQRSRNMSAVKSRNTKPELVVRKFLAKAGVKYRCNVRDLPGKPDIAIKKYNLALDVHGCFWHGHDGCKKAKLPSSNTDFWTEKIKANKLRDTRTRLALQSIGFTYYVIWECELSAVEPPVLKEFIQTYFLRKQNLN